MYQLSRGGQSVLLLSIAVGRLWALLGEPPAAGADVEKTILSSLVRPGGYFFVSGSADEAFGSTQFYRSSRLDFQRPTPVGEFLWTWGFEAHSVSDNWLPFTGETPFSLLGLSARLMKPAEPSQVQPFVTLGGYRGRVKSSRRGISETDFVPSAAVGAQWWVTPALALEASFRMSRELADINTDGFGLTLRYFWGREGAPPPPE